MTYQHTDELSCTLLNADISCLTRRNFVLGSNEGDVAGQFAFAILTRIFRGLNPLPIFGRFFVVTAILDVEYTVRWQIADEVIFRAIGRATIVNDVFELDVQRCQDVRLHGDHGFFEILESIVTRCDNGNLQFSAFELIHGERQSTSRKV